MGTVKTIHIASVVMVGVRQLMIDHEDVPEAIKAEAKQREDELAAAQDEGYQLIAVTPMEYRGDIYLVYTLHK